MIPNEIAEKFLKMWVSYVKEKYPEADIRNMSKENVYNLQKHTKLRRRGFLNVIKGVCDHANQDSYFWKRILLGNYDLYFEKFPSAQKIEINNEIYMI